MSFFWNDGSRIFGLNHHPKLGAQDLNPESYRVIGIVEKIIDAFLGQGTTCIASTFGGWHDSIPSLP